KRSPGVAVAINTVSIPPSLANTEELAPNAPKWASFVSRALIAMTLPRKNTTSTPRPYCLYKPASRATQKGVGFGPVEPKASTARSSFCAWIGCASKQNHKTVPIPRILFFMLLTSVVLYHPQLFCIILEWRAENEVAHNRQDDRAGRDRERRPGPLGYKTGLHAAKLPQATARETVEARDAPAERFLSSQLNGRVQESFENRAQGADRDQEAECHKSIAGRSKANQACREND